jgi:hypothetical protein
MSCFIETLKIIMPLRDEKVKFEPNRARRDQLYNMNLRNREIYV